MYLITGWGTLGVDSGEVRLNSVVVLKGAKECGKKRSGLQPAGFSDGQDSFHPAVAFFAGGTLGALLPQHAEAQDSFCVIVGGGKPPFSKRATGMRALFPAGGILGVDHEKGHHGVGHDPEPLQHILFALGGLIDMVDLAAARRLADGLVGRGDGR